MLDLRTGKVCKTLIPKISEGIFDVMAVFNATNEYVLYYHSGRKTIRAFRRKDGNMIANFRVQADLKGMETTADGRWVEGHLSCLSCFILSFLLLLVILFSLLSWTPSM